MRSGDSSAGTVFDLDSDIVFSLNKPPRTGWRPVGGVRALGGETVCELVECDPSDHYCPDPAKACHATRDACSCACGSCYGEYCDCNDATGTPMEGYFEDYSATPGAYDFGGPRDQCYTPGVGALGGYENPACKCSPECSDEGSGSPHPDADPEVCCKTWNESHQCVGPNLADVSRAVWQRYDYENSYCYFCSCPDGYRKEVKFQDGWDCRPGDPPSCEPVKAIYPRYKTEEECKALIDSGDCAQKYWYCRWNPYGFKFECRETAEQVWTHPINDEFWATWYTTREHCEEHVNYVGNLGDKGIGRCEVGWRCQKLGSAPPGPGYEEGCRPYPLDPVPGQNAPDSANVWYKKEDCDERCCFSAEDNPDAVGLCTYYEKGFNEYLTEYDFHWVRRCRLMTRGECMEQSDLCFMPLNPFAKCPPQFSCLLGLSDGSGIKEGLGCVDYIEGGIAGCDEIVDYDGPGSEQPRPPEFLDYDYYHSWLPGFDGYYRCKGVYYPTLRGDAPYPFP